MSTLVKRSRYDNHDQILAHFSCPTNKQKMCFSAAHKPEGYTNVPAMIKAWENCQQTEKTPRDAKQVSGGLDLF